MVNWNKPDLSSTKTEFPGEVRDMATNAAKMLYSGDTNIPTGAMQWDDTNKIVQRYNGSSFVSAATWDAFDSITVTPSAGVWTPSAAVGAILKFQEFAIIELSISGTQSSATAATLTVTTTGPVIPDHKSGISITASTFGTLHQPAGGGSILGSGQILNSGNAIVLRRGDLTNFGTTTHAIQLTTIYPI